MIPILVTSVSMIIGLLLINSFVNALCGFNSEGHTKALEGAFTILFLYLFILTLLNSNMLPLGIPFVDKMDATKSLSSMFRNNLGDFVLECVELISLTFLISFLSSLIPSGMAGSGITGQFFRSVILVLIGVLANNYFLTLMHKTVFLSWSVTALQCFFSGAAMVLTPAMMLGNLLQLNPDNPFIAFLVKKLPQTKIGQSIATATSNSILLVGIVLIFESQFGSIAAALSQVPLLISLFAPCIITLFGIRILIKLMAKSFS